MDFSDESYVRQYTRKTVTNRLLGWEGRAVMHAMLGEFDRAGMFAFRGDVASSIAAVTDLPIEVVTAGLERLVDTETWFIHHEPAVLFWPTYLEAQTCSKPDRVRQRESRQRRASDPVTNRDEPSRPVTSGHTPSRNVTLSLAQPSLAQPNKEGEHPTPSPVVSDPDGFEVRAERVIFRNLDGWLPSPSLLGEAHIAGLSLEYVEARILELRNGPIGGVRGVFDRDDYVRRQFPKWRAWAETDRLKAQQTTQAPRAGGFGRAPVLALEPSSKHVQYAKRHGVDLSHIVREMVEEGIVENLGLGRAKELLGERLSKAARARGTGATP